MRFIPPTDSDPTKEQSKIEHDVTPCNLIPCCFELKHILTLGKDEMHLHKRQGCYANKEQEFLQRPYAHLGNVVRRNFFILNA